MNKANPIYDEVFKLLMNNTHIARFFIGNILEETIVELEVNSQETACNKGGAHRDLEGNLVAITIFRLDFIATYILGFTL